MSTEHPTLLVAGVAFEDRVCQNVHVEQDLCGSGKEERTESADCRVKNV